ncbi:MAG TPA: serine protease [Vicinamibacteria bacterium]|nr:serine protease [Vicinamibacteria bacterium]
MRRWGSSIFGVGVCLGVAASALAADPAVREKQSETVRHPATDRGAQMRELHESLKGTEPGRGLGRALAVDLSSVEKASAEPEAKDGRYRVGVSKAVGIVVDFSRKALPFGERETRPDGSRVWSGAVRAPGASALRLELSPFELPEGAELYVYGPDRQAFGPYTGRGPIDDGQLWTNTVRGEEVRLQLRLPEGAKRARLVVASVGYMGKAFPGALEQAGLCADNALCVENAECHNGTPAESAKQAVADMLFASGGFYYLCTGGLLADSAPGDIPYFLTANHCISKPGEASSLETYFDYTIACGQTNCTAPFDASPRNPETLGATIKAKNRTSDFTLLQLSSTPSTEGGEVYLGWNATPVANTDGTHLYRISHPAGSPQAYSEHDVDTGKTTCSSWPRGAWIYSQDVLGATEGGSSGSPVVNGSSQVVGQLSGACGFNVNDSCDSESNATVDGAFANYFSQVAPFLVGGGSCKAAGQSCSMNSECCSNSCKGKPGAKTCK